MCDIALATLAITAGSAGASFVGQRQQARAQRRYQSQAMEAERQRAIQEQQSIRMRQAQEQEATNRELGDVALKAREARARATTSAGEAGVAGMSVDALIDDYTRQEAAYRVGVGRQQEMRDLQTGLALTDAGFRSANRLIDINRPVNEPGFLQGALSVASAGISGYRSGLELKRELNS
jgi:hypothetical protein